MKAAASKPSWRTRVQLWLADRQPRTDQLRLTQRNVYILPTRPGWMMALTLLAMLVGSINYQLNLGYLLTFLLAGSAAVGLHVCHANLRGLVLHLPPPAPTHVGHALHLGLVLSQSQNRLRPALACRVLGQTDDAWADVLPQDSTTVQLQWLPPARGQVDVPALQLETRYPLGLFRAWTVWRPATTAWVYPKPEQPAPPLPAGQAHGSEMGPSRSATEAEPDGVRAYRRGDPMRSIVWKRAAQAMARGTGELVSRDQAPTPLQSTLWLDWNQTSLSNPDARLSRLTAWVLAADRLGLTYGLRLPHLEKPPDSGPLHRRACLEALALC